MAAVALPHPLLERFQTARDLLRPAHAGANRETCLPTSLAPVDRLLEGGLARGTMVEITGRRSCGRFSIVLGALATATRAGEATALVDLGGHFRPHQAEALGLDLERLLWLQPPRLKEALAGAEILVTGGFRLVALDLGAPPVAGGRGSQSSWQRLLKAARAHRATLLVSTPYRCCGPAATTVIEIERPRVRWSGRDQTPRLLDALQTRVRLGKAPGRVPGATESLWLRFSTGSIHHRPEAGRASDEPIRVPPASSVSPA